MTVLMGDLIPLPVLTGFFETGKITLLNRLLKQPKLTDTVVLIANFVTLVSVTLQAEHGFDHCGPPAATVLTSIARSAWRQQKRFQHARDLARILLVHGELSLR